MIPGFQQYLVDKGFKRTCTFFKDEGEQENYKDIILSSYNPLHYNFSKDGKYCYWGLAEMHKPPVMFLGDRNIKVIQNKENFRTNDDGYRILFSKWKEDKFDEIYSTFITDGKYFIIDCTDEKDILTFTQ